MGSLRPVGTKEQQGPQWADWKHSKDTWEPGQKPEPPVWSLPSSLPRTLHKLTTHHQTIHGDCKKTDRIYATRPSALLTVSGAAAGIRTAAAADVAAAGVRTTLAPADPQQQEEQDAAQNHGAHERPLCFIQTHRNNEDTIN